MSWLKVIFLKMRTGPTLHTAKVDVNFCELNLIFGLMTKKLMAHKGRIFTL